MPGKGLDWAKQRRTAPRIPHVWQRACPTIQLLAFCFVFLLNRSSQEQRLFLATLAREWPELILSTQ